MLQAIDPTMPANPEVGSAFSPIDIARRIHVSFSTSEHLQPASRNYGAIGRLMAYGALAAASAYAQIRHGVGIDASHISATPDTNATHHMPEHHLVADATHTSPSPKPHAHESYQPLQYPRTTSTNNHDVEFNTAYPSYFDNRDQEANTAHNRDFVEGALCSAIFFGGAATLGILIAGRGKWNRYARLQRKGERARARGERQPAAHDPHLTGETYPSADAPTYGPNSPSNTDNSIVPGL